MARQREDLTGRKFNSLTVISYNEEVSVQKKGAHWNCKCDCGNEVVVYSSHLRGGCKTSCGCMRKRVNLTEQRDSNKTNCRHMKNDNYKNHKNGINNISKHLKSMQVVRTWSKKCKRQANYTCEITGKVYDIVHVHHLKACNTIIQEAHELNNIQVKPQVKDYTEEELHKLEEYVASWHKDNSNAVVMCPEVHKLFHGLYGSGNNTPEQFKEFKQRYLSGEFEELI